MRNAKTKDSAGNEIKTQENIIKQQTKIINHRRNKEANKKTNENKNKNRRKHSKQTKNN